MKYYFITYQATTRKTPYSVSIWNQCIDVSPMEFIKKVEVDESFGSRTYLNFIVINTLEISLQDFEKYDGYF